MARNLERCIDSEKNLLLYDDTGSLLGGLILRNETPYVSPRMLYRYCALFLEIPVEVSWEIFHLNEDGSTGRLLRQTGHSMVEPGSYIILDQNTDPIQITVTSDLAPRRVHSGRTDTSRDKDNPQGYFRDGLRERDRSCTITGKKPTSRNPPFSGLIHTHIYPVARLGNWNAQNFRQFITDTSSENCIGQSGIYSLQNGLLLRADIHDNWDDWLIAVDPDEDFKVICFFADDEMLGGRRLQATAINASNTNHHISHDILRWHLRMCVLKNMKGNVGVPEWEYDLGTDDIGGIMTQEDAGERMEVELFSRLGPLIA